MKCCYIWLLILASSLTIVLGIYLFCKDFSLKIIISICTLILGLGICAIVAGYKKSAVIQFAEFYKEVVKTNVQMKSTPNEEDSGNAEKKDDTSSDITDKHIKILEIYADLLRDR